MRLTSDGALALSELKAACRKLGLSVGVVRASSFERSDQGLLDLARELTTNRSSDLVLPDAFPMTPDEGVEATIHHLRLAAMFFETTPEDGCRQINEELARLSRERKLQGHVANAASSFCEVLNTFYDGLRREN